MTWKLDVSCFCWRTFLLCIKQWLEAWKQRIRNIIRLQQWNLVFDSVLFSFPSRHFLNNSQFHSEFISEYKKTLLHSESCAFFELKSRAKFKWKTGKKTFTNKKWAHHWENKRKMYANGWSHFCVSPFFSLCKPDKKMSVDRRVQLYPTPSPFCQTSVFFFKREIFTLITNTDKKNFCW